MVGVKIDPDRHQRWKEGIEESTEFNTLSQAIRVGVEQVLFEEGTEGEFSVNDEEIVEQLDDIEKQLNKTRTAVIETNEKMPTLDEFAEEVLYQLSEYERYEKSREGGWEDGL